MNEYPRRRRLDPEPPKRGGIPIVPLMVLVILGGLLLGGVLTRLFGAGESVHAPTPQPSFTPLPDSTPTLAPTPSPTPSASPRGAASPSNSPVAMPTIASPAASASSAASATPLASSSPAHSAAPRSTPSPSVARSTVIILTPEPTATHAPTPTPTPEVTATPVAITGANTTDHAAAIVSAYLAALARGDSSTATGYLANGLPNESFVNANVSVSVNDLRASRNDDGSFAVSAQIVTSKGTYFATFTLRQSALGLQITDHSATHI